jgi:hypothetical protein
LPRKRFVQEAVVGKAQEYLGTDHSYRKTAEEEGTPLVYDDRQASDEQLPVGLAPSTVWRWLSWLGGMTDALHAGWELIRQKEPNAALHREPWAVSPGKYRLERRRGTLQQALQVLAVDRVCAGLFGAGIFPRYATSSGGT